MIKNRAINFLLFTHFISYKKDKRRRTFLCWWRGSGCGCWESRDAALDTRPSNHASTESTEHR